MSEKISYSEVCEAMGAPELAEAQRLREVSVQAEEARADLALMAGERDDASRALDMERAAHRVTAARQERFGAALTEVVTALKELPGEAAFRVALRAAGQALAER